MSFRLVQNGTSGSKDWKYQGTGVVGHCSYVPTLQDIWWLSIPTNEVATTTQILANLQNQVAEIKSQWYDYLTEDWDYDGYYNGLSRDLEAFVDRVDATTYSFDSFKMCILKETALGESDYKIVYQDGPNSYNYGTVITMYENMMMWGIKPVYTDITFLTGYITDHYGPQEVYLFDIGLPIFDDLNDCLDYLYNTIPDPSTDDPYSSVGENSDIHSSTTFEDINNGLLSDLTILAEIDSQNLQYIAAALNTDIDISQDLGTNIGKVARALCQNNIKDGIMSLKAVPIPVNGTLPYSTGSTETLFEPIGGHPVSGKKLNRYIKKYDIGVMRIEREFNDYRDYMCDYSIYLPFSGIHKLDASIIVGQTLILKCDIDFLCGTILYHIIVNDNKNTRDIYQFTGDCAIEIPITSEDYSQKYQAIVNGIFSGVGMVAGSALGGPVGGAAVAGATMSGLATAGNALTTQGQYMQTGKLVPNSSALSCLQCYMIINKPISVTPAQIATVKGKPCHKVKTLSNCSGFTIASNVKLDGVAYATDDDKAAIRSMLAQGVYL